MTTATQDNRLDYLDAVRAFALILGVIFHAGLAFIPIYIGWAVMDVSTSMAVAIFSLVSHSFRMALFFLVAGFFSHMTFHSKGGAAFIKSRFVRICIPFVVGWFILRPLLVSGWIMGAESMQGEANIVGGLAAGFATLGSLPSGLLVGSHLWFLYYLVLVTVSVLILRFLVSLHAPTQVGLTRLADSTSNWISTSRIAIVAVSIPTACCLWYMSRWGMDTPDQSLVPDLSVLLIYGGFFLFGWLLHRTRGQIEHFAALSWGKVCLGLLAVVAAVVLSGFERETGHSQYELLKAGFALCYAVMMWSLVSLTIGVFKRILDRPSAFVRYIADASYWLYLVHLPIVIWLQVAVAELPLHWSVKWAVISAVTVAIALLTYDLFVRSTFIGAVLNGRRRSRVLLRRRQVKGSLTMDATK